MLLMAVVAVVLLIVCANVASLLLARASARGREMAIRGALGGGLGVLLSVWGLGAVRASIPDFVASVVPATREIGVDLRVLAFSSGVSLFATLLFGLTPALMLSKPAAEGRLANRSSGDGGRRQHRLLSYLVVAEVALSAMLLVGAGLTTRSLWNVLQVNPGFDSHGLMLLDLALPTGKYPDVTRPGLVCWTITRPAPRVAWCRHRRGCQFSPAEHEQQLDDSRHRRTTIRRARGNRSDRLPGRERRLL